MKKEKIIKRFIPLFCATLLLLGSSMTAFAFTYPSYYTQDDLYNLYKKGGGEHEREVFDEIYKDYIVFQKKATGEYMVAILFQYGFDSNDACFYSETTNAITLQCTEVYSIKAEIGTDGRFYYGGYYFLKDSHGCSSRIYDIDDYNVICSTNAIKHFMSEQIFFQMPPNQTAPGITVTPGGAITPVQVEALTGTVQQQMTVIVPIAVGCLALLVGLTILAKKLRIFL